MDFFSKSVRGEEGNAVGNKYAYPILNIAEFVILNMPPDVSVIIA